MTRRSILPLAFLVAGCQYAPLAPLADAAHAEPDAAQIDALTLPTSHVHFVVDKLTMPANNTQATSLGLDLNGDARVDNQFGMFVGVFVGQGVDSQGAMDKAIDTGAEIMLADLGADDLVTEPVATFTMWQGANPTPAACTNAADTVCRKHLTGTGSFAIKQGAPVDAPLLGAIVNGKLKAGPGHLTIQFSLLGSPPMTVTLLGARVELYVTAAGVMGNLAGGISVADINNFVFPALQQGFVPVIARDCTALQNPPACGCVTDSLGKSYLGLFDIAPKDCNISVAEIRDNSLVTSLLAPDVTLEGIPTVSLGFGVHSVGASFAAP